MSNGPRLMPTASLDPIEATTLTSGLPSTVDAPDPVHSLKMKNVPTPLMSFFQKALHVKNTSCPITLDALRAPLHDALSELQTTTNPLVKHDDIATNLTPFWFPLLKRGELPRARKLWRDVLSLVDEWERREGARVHKGSFFYYTGVTELLIGTLDAGFLYMHQALEEDRLSQGIDRPQTPARAFVTLDFGVQEQLFREWVQVLASYLEKRLVTYSEATGQSLTLANFYGHLSSVADDTLFAFVHAAAKLRELEEGTEPTIMRNSFAGLLHEQVLFRSCMIADALVKPKCLPKWKFIDLAAHLSMQGKLRWDKAGLRELNGNFCADFEATLRDVLDGGYQASFGTLNMEERALAVTYGFRNLGAHNVKSHVVVYERFGECAQAVLRTIFLVARTLYS